MTGSPRVISLVSRGREPSLRPPEKVVARERSTGPQGRLIEKSEMEKGVPFSGERGKRASGSPERGKDCEEGYGEGGGGRRHGAHQSIPTNRGLRLRGATSLRD